MSASSTTVVLDVRALLESGDARQKLEAYALLSAQCCESKAQQHSVGALLREKPAVSLQDVHSCVEPQLPQRLLDVVFEDLQAADRTTRLAAARLLCLAAYENLLNQDSIVQLANGFSVGWVHVFAVPASFQERYAADCAASGRAQSVRGFRAFLHGTVVNSYATVYQHVSSYYSGGCRTFLPLAWQFPPPAPEAASLRERDLLSCSSAIPDPACHLVGFYLVPRQAQFPEQDDFYSDELLGAMDAADIERIECVRRMFTAAAAATPSEDTPHSSGAHRALKSALLRTLRENSDTRWVVDTSDGELCDCKGVEPIDQYFAPCAMLTGDAAILTGISDDDERGEARSHLVWNQVLTYSCMRINTERLVVTLGGETLSILATIFQDLALSVSAGSEESVSGHSTMSSAVRRVSSASYAWEAVVVGAILRHPKLPDALKRHVSCFQRGLYQCEVSQTATAMMARSSIDDERCHMREPWRHLLPLRLEQIQPVSWCHFLTQWRVAADTCHALDSSQRRKTTVCSVPSIRQSMVAMDAHSFRDLDDLRQELPNVMRSQRLIDDAQAGSLAPGRIDEMDEADLDSETDITDAHGAIWRRASRIQRRAPRVQADDEGPNLDSSSLAYYLRLFHRMQQSPADLDRLSLQQLREKQAAAAKLHESVAINKKRLADEAKRKCLQVHERLCEEDEKREELERSKAAARSRLQEKHASRHDMALRRRQQQQAHDEARQRALIAQIELEQRELRKRMDAKQQQTKKRAPPPQETLAIAPSRPRPPSAAATSSQRTSGLTRRPLSARLSSSPAAAAAASAMSPEILRQRAQIYGDVVSKIYLAEAARHPQPPPLTVAPPHLARRFTTFRKQSALGDSIDTDQPPASQQQPQILSPPTKLSGDTSGARLEWKLHSSSGDTTDRNATVTSVLAQDREGLDVKIDTISTACTTLVMRNAALAVSERIRIPTVAPPSFAEPRVPAHAIEQQYSALDTRDKQKFRERFNLKSISHRLSYTVLKQFTKIVRRDTAWEEFHEAAARANGGRPTDRLRHADFVLVVQQLGIAASAKKLQLVARRLDTKKNGFVDWEAFYTWWSAQYEDTLLPVSRS